MIIQVYTEENGQDESDTKLAALDATLEKMLLSVPAKKLLEGQDSASQKLWSAIDHFIRKGKKEANQTYLTFLSSSEWYRLTVSTETTTLDVYKNIDAVKPYISYKFFNSYPLNQMIATSENGTETKANATSIIELETILDKVMKSEPLTNLLDGTDPLTVKFKQAIEHFEKNGKKSTANESTVFVYDLVLASTNQYVRLAIHPTDIVLTSYQDTQYLVPLMNYQVLKAYPLSRVIFSRQTTQPASLTVLEALLDEILNPATTKPAS